MVFGVPDSQLVNDVKDVNVHCTSEEQALAISAGCILLGKKPTVYMQNSGLLRCGDIITSLYKPYEITLPPMILSVRHYPKHHEFAGKITYKFLDLIQYDGVIKIIEQVVKDDNRTGRKVKQKIKKNKRKTAKIRKEKEKNR